MSIVIACKHSFKAVGSCVLAVALCLGASAPVVAAPSEVRESAVAQCRFIGKVEGSSGYGKNNGWQDLAKYSARNRAEKLGASHIVWERLIPVGAFNGVAVARLYDCNQG